MKIILASTSSRRAEILKSIADELLIVDPKIDETKIFASKNNIAPATYVLTLGSAKAEAALSITDTGIILSGDSVVVCDGKIYEKPKSSEEAKRNFELFGKHGVTVVNSIVGVRVSEPQLRVSFVDTIKLNRVIPADDYPWETTALQSCGGLLVECCLDIPPEDVERIQAWSSSSVKQLVELLARGQQ